MTTEYLPHDYAPFRNMPNDFRTSIHSNITASTRELTEKIVLYEKTERTQLRNSIARLSTELENERKAREETEDRAVEMAKRVKEERDRRLFTEAVVQKLRKEAGKWRTQLALAQSEIAKANEYVKILQQERDEADAEASELSKVLRGFKQEQLIREAREEGIRLGIEQGYGRGFQQGIQSAPAAPAAAPTPAPTTIPQPERELESIPVVIPPSPPPIPIPTPPRVVRTPTPPLVVATPQLSPLSPPREGLSNNMPLPSMNMPSAQATPATRDRRPSISTSVAESVGAGGGGISYLDGGFSDNRPSMRDRQLSVIPESLENTPSRFGDARYDQAPHTRSPEYESYQYNDGAAQMPIPRNVNMPEPSPSHVPPPSLPPVSSINAKSRRRARAQSISNHNPYEGTSFSVGMGSESTLVGSLSQNQPGGFVPAAININQSQAPMFKMPSPTLTNSDLPARGGPRNTYDEAPPLRGILKMPSPTSTSASALHNTYQQQVSMSYPVAGVGEYANNPPLRMPSPEGTTSAFGGGRNMPNEVGIGRSMPSPSIPPAGFGPISTAPYPTVPDSSLPRMPQAGGFSNPAPVIPGSISMPVPGAASVDQRLPGMPIPGGAMITRLSGIELSVPSGFVPTPNGNMPSLPVIPNIGSDGAGGGWNATGTGRAKMSNASAGGFAGSAGHPSAMPVPTGFGTGMTMPGSTPMLGATMNLGSLPMPSVPASTFGPTLTAASISPAMPEAYIPTISPAHNGSILGMPNPAVTIPSVFGMTNNSVGGMMPQPGMSAFTPTIPSMGMPEPGGTEGAAAWTVGNAASMPIPMPGSSPVPPVLTMPEPTVAGEEIDGYGGGSDFVGGFGGDNMAPTGKKKKKKR